MRSRMPGYWLSWWSDPTSHDDKPMHGTSQISDFPYTAGLKGFHR